MVESILQCLHGLAQLDQCRFAGVIEFVFEGQELSSDMFNATRVRPDVLCLQQIIVVHRIVLHLQCLVRLLQRENSGGQFLVCHCHAGSNLSWSEDRNRAYNFILTTLRDYHETIKSMTYDKCFFETTQK